MDRLLKEVEMEIFTKLEDINIEDRTVCALGNFDGVHLGHQMLIKRAVEVAKERGIKSAVFTFSNHPRNFIGRGEKVKNILYQNEKAEIIASLGVDYLFNIPFDHVIMKTKAENYIKEILVNKLKVSAIVCGFNYHFGYKAQGSPELLIEMGRILGYDVIKLEPCKVDGEVVSSSLIRKEIQEGDLGKVKKFLGRYYAITGEVVVGNRLGRKLGFPTSNINIDHSMVTPPNGVYVTFCTYNGIRYPSITSVGVKPTIGTYGKNVETHIFGFDKELYGKNIIVEFVKMMREEVKFGSIEDLSSQVLKDMKSAEAYHKKMLERGRL